MVFLILLDLKGCHHIWDASFMGLAMIGSRSPVLTLDLENSYSKLDTGKVTICVSHAETSPRNETFLLSGVLIANTGMNVQSRYCVETIIV